MVEFTLVESEKYLKDATENFQNSENESQQRWAIHLWLSGALTYLYQKGLPTFPAQELMRALEGLERGHSSPLFRIKENNAAGGRERTHAGLRGDALACIDAFVNAGWKVPKAISFTAHCFEPVLKLDEKSFANLRKKVKSETGKKEPKRYKALIAAYNEAMSGFKEQVDSAQSMSLKIERDRKHQLNKLWEGAAFQRIVFLQNFMDFEL